MLPAQAVVINLRRRPDRLHTFVRRWKTLGLDCPLTVLEATDARDQPPADPRWRVLPAGAFGCWDSHIRALRQARGGPVLVLEDDVVFAEHFATALTDLTAPPDWELIHLGGQHIIRPEPVVPGLVRPTRMLRTHAYLAHYPQIVASGLRTRRAHVDYAFTQLPLRRYAVEPWLAGQDDSPGDVTRRQPNGIDFWQEANVEAHRGA